MGYKPINHSYSIKPFLWLWRKCGENVEKMWSKVSEVLPATPLVTAELPGQTSPPEDPTWPDWRSVIENSPLVSYWFPDQSWMISGSGPRLTKPRHFFGVGKLRWKKNAPSFEHEIDSRCLSSNMLSTTDPAPSGNSYLKPSKKLEALSSGKYSFKYVYIYRYIYIYIYIYIYLCVCVCVGSPGHKSSRKYSDPVTSPKKCRMGMSHVLFFLMKSHRGDTTQARNLVNATRWCSFAGYLLEKAKQVGYRWSEVRKVAINMYIYNI